ncbi:hypothetical protein NOU13_23565 [Rhodococcus erythropolis]|nr:sigma factor-like helix-turn-helix DNA-binding protein [Rhodococcus erythropolis]MCQ4127489.1 hypothetical protein [Rhodococcus erythropolis]
MSFAVPTMMEEVRKHFRDKGWGVRVRAHCRKTTSHSRRRNPRSPNTSAANPPHPKLADETGVEPSEIRQIVAANDSYQSTSLDVETFKDGVSITDTLGDYDTALDGIDNHETLRPSLLALPERDRTMLLYRFFGEITQAEIAAKVGLSPIARLPPNVDHVQRSRLDRAGPKPPSNAESRAHMAQY